MENNKEAVEVLQYHLASLIKEQEQRIDWSKGDIPTDILEMKQRTIKAEQDLIDSLSKACLALEREEKRKEQEKEPFVNMVLVKATKYDELIKWLDKENNRLVHLETNFFKIREEERLAVIREIHAILDEKKEVLQNGKQ